MSPTEILRAEHANIKGMIGILLTIGNRIDSGTAVVPDHLRQLIDFLREYADGIHHAKEEDLLFATLESAGITETFDLIGTLQSEHTLSRMFLDALSDSILDYSSGESGVGSLFNASADAYAELLMHHICQEDDFLFPLVDKSLSDEHKRQLQEAFDKNEAEARKTGLAENHLKVLSKLKAAYPIPLDSPLGLMIDPKK